MKLELRPRTELTLRTLAALTDGRRWRAAELAGAVGTTPAYLAHVVAPLTRSGWTESAPGPTGGHRLAVDLATISLLDVIEAVEGVTDDGHCVMAAARPCPSPEPCALHEAWSQARDALIQHLAATPLDSIIPQKALQEAEK